LIDISPGEATFLCGLQRFSLREKMAVV
jgi:hypothetical protein